MKILMLNYEYPPIGGGAANACYYLLKELSKNPELTIDLITISANNRFEVEQFSKNIRIFKLKVQKKSIHYWTALELAKWSWKAMKFSKRLIQKNKYDLCHCWFGWPCGFIGYLHRKKVPYIVALRGSDVPNYNPRLKIIDQCVMKPLSKIIWKNAKSVIANSQGLKQLAMKTLPRNIDIIPNGIDTSDFKPNPKKKRARKIRLISTGRLIDRKGYKYLISALKDLHEKYELTLIGEGNQEQELKRLAEQNNVSVTFKGKIPHNKIAQELQNADIFVLPSLNEGMSNSALEAMACGLPLILTSVGGSQEIIQNNKNGMIIQKKSTASIQEALTKLDQDKIQQMSKQSIQISKQFSWQTVASKYNQTYQEVI